MCNFCVIWCPNADWNLNHETPGWRFTVPPIADSLLRRLSPFSIQKRRHAFYSTAPYIYSIKLKNCLVLSCLGWVKISSGLPRSMITP
jgi:hypothetical protein